MNFSHEDAERQAPDTILFYYAKLCREVDDIHGEGYAAKNPALMSALVTATVQDYIEAARGIMFRASGLDELIPGLISLATKICEYLRAKE
jgi:hypothetical protein